MLNSKSFEDFLSPNSTIFLISDTHFYHKNIIKYCNRPFKNEIEMNETIINNWNSVITDNVVLHLGDFAMGWDKTFNSKKECYKDLMSKLNGNKFLIKGNHDKETNEFYKDIGFINAYEYLIYKGNLFCHYPLKIDEYTNESRKLFILKMKEIVKKYQLNIIHGHIHNNIFKNKHYNVSVEMINYTPIQLNELSNLPNSNKLSSNLF